MSNTPVTDAPAKRARKAPAPKPPVAKQAKTTVKAKTVKDKAKGKDARGAAPARQPKAQPKAPRPGGKLEQVLALLRLPGGGNHRRPSRGNRLAAPQHPRLLEPGGAAGPAASIVSELVEGSDGASYRVYTAAVS